MRYCNKCGNKLDDSAKFCVSCGAEQLSIDNSEMTTSMILKLREKKTVIIMIGMLIIAIVVIGISFIIGRNNKNINEKSIIAKNVRKDIDVAESFAELFKVILANEDAYNQIIWNYSNKMVSYNELLSYLESYNDLASVYNTVYSEAIPSETYTDMLGNGDEIISSAGYYFYYDNNNNEEYVFVKSNSNDHKSRFEVGYYELYPELDNDLKIILDEYDIHQ